MALTPDPDNEFEKKGVTFKIITPDMLTQVEDFMWKNFFPDEPVSRLNESMFNNGAFINLLCMHKNRDQGAKFLNILSHNTQFMNALYFCISQCPQHTTYFKSYYL